MQVYLRDWILSQTDNLWVLLQIDNLWSCCYKIESLFPLCVAYACMCVLKVGDAEVSKKRPGLCLNKSDVAEVNLCCNLLTLRPVYQYLI